MFELVLNITVLKWDEYNPRKDYKKPWWFACANTLVTDPDFYSFNHGEFKAWIYILSQASIKRSATVFIDLKHAERVSNILKKDFLSSTQKLERMQMITVVCTDSVQSTVVTQQNITLQNKTEHNTTAPLGFDFEILYRNYPRKLGKAKGLKVLEKTINSQDDYDSLSKAISNYAQDCRLKGTEEKFIKHFSSFIGTVENQTWRDYVTLVASASNSKKQNAVPPATERMESLETMMEKLL